MRDEDGGSENNSRIGTLRRCSTYLYIHIYIYYYVCIQLFLELEEMKNKDVRAG